MFGIHYIKVSTTQYVLHFVSGKKKRAGVGLAFFYYKPAASIVVVLLWVYYNAQIVLAGAEFTRVYAESHGSRKPAIKPEGRPSPSG